MFCHYLVQHMLMKKTDLHPKFLLRKCKTEIIEIFILEN